MIDSCESAKIIHPETNRKFILQNSGLHNHLLSMIDDVCTTGESSRQVARYLMYANVESVKGVF